MSLRVTCRAGSNIAVIKYWGKRDEALVLPLNDSISCALDCDLLAATTTVYAARDLAETRLWLNGREEPVGARLRACVDAARAVARERRTCPEELLALELRICSENNFPTAAGLASSAAGYACLAVALARLYGIPSPEDASRVARVGSGSACRSVLGGFVRWRAGVLPDGKDSLAAQVAPADHWPELRALVLVVSDDAKKTASTGGMRDSVRTSQLLGYRTSTIVPERVERMQRAILERDFAAFAEIAMKDSNQFHAICCDTYPPCAYMNDVSRAIVAFVHRYNEAWGDNHLAYTFDAGPNACLYMLEDHVPFVLSMIYRYFPSDKQGSEGYLRGAPVEPKPLPKDVQEKLNVEPYDKDKIKYLIHSGIGTGPYEMKEEKDHLLDEKGSPKKVK